MSRALLGLVLGGALSAAGCRKAPPLEQAGLVLAVPPKDMPIELGIDFGNAIELLGAKLEPASGLKPGARVELTLYWRRHGPIASGYRLFTHVLDEAGERILNLDTIGPLRRLEASEPALPPSDFQKGQVYVDRQAFSLPYSLRTDSFSVVAGLYRGEARLAVSRGPGPSDRAVVLKSSVVRPTVNKALPFLWVPRRREDLPIAIDGRLDDPAWQYAASTGQFVNVATGEPPNGAQVSGSAKLLFDREFMYVAFDVLDEDLRGGFDPDQTDPHLWTKDTIELMVDPDGDGDNKDYYEIQVNPQNLVFDSRFDAYNRPKVEPDGPFGHQEWSSRVKSAVSLTGTLDDQREDEGYAVELAIAWSAFDKAKRVPPKPEDIWRMNFYAMQDNGGVAWSPILGEGNFHLASRFGRVRFAR